MRFTAAFLLIFIVGTTGACVMEANGLTPILLGAVHDQLGHLTRAAVEVATTFFA